MKNRLFFLCTVFVMLALPSYAETPEDKGLAIVREAEKRDGGYGNFVSTMIMTLKDRHGNESRREIKIKNLEVEGDGDKSLSIFNNPADVKGTAMLTFTHKFGNDDQWLYLPALKRVKRISSANKSGSFMGSEFAYEDIASQEVEKYKYKWLRNESYKNKDCFVIEEFPADKKSGYSRLVVWMDSEIYMPLKIYYYDRKNFHLKTLLFEDYKQYLDRYWRTGSMVMENHLTGKSTRLAWKKYEFRVGLTEKDFNRNSLKRAR